MTFGSPEISGSAETARRAESPASPASPDQVRILLARAETVDGYPTFGFPEQGGDEDSPDVDYLRVGGGDHGDEHERDRPDAVVRRERSERGLLLTLAIDPDARNRRDELIRAAARTAETDAQVWVIRPTPADERAWRAAGFEPTRRLYRLARRLPVDRSDASEGDPAAPLGTRPFRPDVDDDAWLAVNNRAFAWHPEQSGWTREMLAAHRAEPWFDDDGFLLHDDEHGRLDGFCWTRVHDEEDPPVGEIYVIGVDPAAGGRGLGRRLVVAGLDHLAARGLAFGMLYCESDNLPALRLYLTLGFHVETVQTCFTRSRGPSREESRD